MYRSLFCFSISEIAYFGFQLIACSVHCPVWLPLPVFHPVPEERLPNLSLKMLVVACFSSRDEDATLLFRVQRRIFACIVSQRGRTVIESKRRQSRLSPLAALDWKESNMRIAGDSWSPLCIFCCFHALLGCVDPNYTFLWSSSLMMNYWRGA